MISQKAMGGALQVLLGLLMLALVFTFVVSITGGKTRDSNTALSLLSGDTTKACETLADEGQAKLGEDSTKTIKYSLEFKRTNCEKTAKEDGNEGDVVYYPSAETPTEGLFCCLYAVEGSN